MIGPFRSYAGLWNYLQTTSTIAASLCPIPGRVVLNFQKCCFPDSHRLSATTWSSLAAMAITILPPIFDEESPEYGSTATSENDSSDESVLNDEDERPAKRARLTNSTSKIVTPGQTITEDTQWMR